MLTGMATNQAEPVHKVNKKRHLRTIERSRPRPSGTGPEGGSGPEQAHADTDGEIERRDRGQRSGATVGDQGRRADGMFRKVHICILVNMISGVKRFYPNTGAGRFAGEEAIWECRRHGYAISRQVRVRQGEDDRHLLSETVTGQGLGS